MLVKKARLSCDSFANWRFCAVIAILGLAGNANAVIRSPFPLRPSPPDHAHYILIGHDSINASPWPKAGKRTPSR